jgi:hypothetical protein
MMRSEAQDCAVAMPVAGQFVGLDRGSKEAGMEHGEFVPAEIQPLPRRHLTPFAFPLLTMAN